MLSFPTTPKVMVSGSKLDLFLTLEGQKYKFPSIFQNNREISTTTKN